MKVTLITGTSTGIGFETAVYFAKQGRKVYASMRNTAKAAELVKLKTEGQLPLEILELDVTDNDSIRVAIEKISAAGDTIDVLVNNAGIGCAGPLEELDEKAHRSVFDTNYFGAINLTKAILPQMRANREGTIINITSFAGLLAVPNQFAYSASKFALEAASEAMAGEVKPFGIRVSLIEPGVTKTAIFENAVESSVFDKSSPYVDTMKKNGKIFAYGLRNPESPVNVAKLIFDVAGSDNPKLRYLIGKDAENFMKGREKMTDEQWVDLFGTTNQKEYIDEMKRYFKIDI